MQDHVDIPPGASIPDGRASIAMPEGPGGVLGATLAASGVEVPCLSTHEEKKTWNSAISVTRA
jgi:hypothetical protein